MGQNCVRVPSRSGRNHPKRKASSGVGGLRALAITSIALAFIICQVGPASARYLQPSNHEAAANRRNFQRAGNSMPAMRRESFDDADGSGDGEGESESDIDDADQRAAASYRNQDEGANQNGEGNVQSDGFDDTEPGEWRPIVGFDF